jgi:hypothetical protein
MTRVIYSLIFDLESSLPKEILQFVVPLDAGGRARLCRPCPPKRRVIDLRPGDFLYFEPARKEYFIKAVSAYRDAQWKTLPADVEGYVVRAGRDRRGEWSRK